MKKILLVTALVTLGLMTAASAATTDASAPQGTAEVDVSTTELAILTGRWRLIFGTKICGGEIVHLPGESQCI